MLVEKPQRRVDEGCVQRGLGLRGRHGLCSCSRSSARVDGWRRAGRRPVAVAGKRDRDHGEQGPRSESAGGCCCVSDEGQSEAVE
eukprot:2037996-Prymnesium_polylepis.1